MRKTRLRLKRLGAIWAAATALGAGAALAQTEEALPGPEVGAEAPAFEARDHTGATRTFADLTGPDGLLLLFFRSADW